MESCTQETIAAVTAAADILVRADLVSSIVGAFVGILLYQGFERFLDWFASRRESRVMADHD
jgi:hypothetical protein